MRFIGDVHGNISRYLEKIDPKQESLQIGDMGIGFKRVILPKLNSKDKFIRGNHDDPHLCKIHPNYAGEYGLMQDNKLFFMGGAYSTDIAFRLAQEKLHGIKIWWEDEQLSYEELLRAEKLYKQAKPKIVCTHTCPQSVANRILANFVVNYQPKTTDQTRTGESLQKMFTLHQPEVWIFGHWHMDLDFKFAETRFICLGELSYIDLEI